MATLLLIASVGSGTVAALRGTAMASGPERPLPVGVVAQPSPVASPAAGEPEAIYTSCYDEAPKIPNTCFTVVNGTNAALDFVRVDLEGGSIVWGTPTNSIPAGQTGGLATYLDSFVGPANAGTARYTWSGGSGGQELRWSFRTSLTQFRVDNLVLPPGIGCTSSHRAEYGWLIVTMTIIQSNTPCEVPVIEQTDSLFPGVPTPVMVTPTPARG